MHADSAPPARRYAQQVLAGVAWADIGLVLLAVIVFISLAGSFAGQQAIWVDETTQLSGLALPFGEQLAWLAGNSDLVLGVPPDRMPPLSYWIGSLWAAAFGLSESAMRWLGIAAVCAAAPALYLSGRLAGGRAGGLFLLGLTLFSGNIVAQAGAIRAYPLFFAFTAWAAYFFVRLVLDDDRSGETRRFGLLCLFLLLASYTHFFGLVAAACIMAALWTDRMVMRRGTTQIIVASCVFGLLAIGLVPFVVSAFGVSSAAGGSPGIAEVSIDVARLIFRLFVHPSQLVVTIALVAFLVCLTALAVLLLLRLGAANSPAGRWDQPALNSPWRKLAVLAMPILLAVIVLALSTYAISSFDVLAPHYNMWLIPLPPIILAVAFRRDLAGGYLRNLAIAVGAVAIACSLVGVVSLQRHAQLFSHGPGEWVAAQIDAPEATLVIHDQTGPWGHLYFPLFFLTGGAVEQWLHDKDAGQFRRILPHGTEFIIDPERERRPFETVMEAHTISMDSMRLAAIARGESPCAFGGGDTILRAPGLPPVSYFCAFFATELAVMRQ